MKHSRDKFISFEPRSHRYTITHEDGEKYYPPSVSKVASRCFKPFDSDTAVDLVLKKPQYHGMTRAEIKQQWKEAGHAACTRGTRFHNSVEHFLHPRLTEQWDQRDEVLKKQFLRWWDKKKSWDVYRLEWAVWKLLSRRADEVDTQHAVAGTIDAVFKTPDGYVLVDWKTCKAIKKTGFGQALHPLQNYEDCNFVKYSLQLNLYRFIVESAYNIKIAKMIVVNFNEAQLSAREFEVETIDDDLLYTILVNRR